MKEKSKKIVSFNANKKIDNSTNGSSEVRIKYERRIISITSRNSLTVTEVYEKIISFSKD